MSWPDSHFTLKTSSVETTLSGFGRLNFCPGQLFHQAERWITISLLVTCSSGTPCCRTPLADPSVKHDVKLPPLQLWSPPDFTASPDTSPSEVSQPKDNVTALLGLSSKENSFHTVLGPRLLSLISKDALKRKTSKERTDDFYFGISVYLFGFFFILKSAPIFCDRYWSLNNFFIRFPEGYKPPQ